MGYVKKSTSFFNISFLKACMQTMVKQKVKSAIMASSHIITHVKVFKLYLSILNNRMQQII